mmetsp:Transcript_8910/g.34949  ORF Transcript_8910/g.34949 Transcript_8910/m.34949 type:complete len:241 (-) Transcript_8910:500-1222(-)
MPMCPPRKPAAPVPAASMASPAAVPGSPAAKAPMAPRLSRAALPLMRSRLGRVMLAELTRPCSLAKAATLPVAVMAPIQAPRKTLTRSTVPRPLPAVCSVAVRAASATTSAAADAIAGSPEAARKVPTEVAAAATPTRACMAATDCGSCMGEMVRPSTAPAAPPAPMRPPACMRAPALPAMGRETMAARVPVPRPMTASALPMRAVSWEERPAMAPMEESAPTRPRVPAAPGKPAAAARP